MSMLILMMLKMPENISQNILLNEISFLFLQSPLGGVVLTLCV